ncbi:MAG TPA: MltA domain-containing protein [Steroidobacteraceae bacterium]|nr:MltA domain-containing protein [Steroidobacteraceae bacterium]
MQAPLRHLLLALCTGLGTLACSTLPKNCPPPPPPLPHIHYEAATWEQLPGWRSDALQEAWPALVSSCEALAARAPQWSEICAGVRAQPPSDASQARSFLERNFVAYRIVRQIGRETQSSGLITGYFEPQLAGSRSASARFNVPLYAPPPDLLTVDLGALYPELKGKRVRARLEGHRVVPYYSRAELSSDPQLGGAEIVWVDDALGAFVLEVQGSGRVQLPDGQIIRLHYADENGHPYHSIGRYLVDRGELTLEQATMPGIRRWAAAHPQRLQELLDANPSVVFFREEPLRDPTQGPRGSLGVPLTAGRSIAVDRSVIPLGAPVFLASTWPGTTIALDRLVLAQDTGGAIRGAPRADLFWGTGEQAAERAGNMRQSGAMWLLWPKGLALPAG